MEFEIADRPQQDVDDSWQAFKARHPRETAPADLGGARGGNPDRAVSIPEQEMVS
jgi:hypothetical protein